MLWKISSIYKREENSKVNPCVAITNGLSCFISNPVQFLHAIAHHFKQIQDIILFQK